MEVIFRETPIVMRHLYPEHHTYGPYEQTLRKPAGQLLTWALASGGVQTPSTPFQARLRSRAGCSWSRRAYLSVLAC